MSPSDSSNTVVRSRICVVGESVDSAVEPDVLAHGEIGVEREALAHVADVAPDLVALGADVESRDVRRALARREKSDEHLDRGRLARAVGAQEAEDFAGPDVEGDVIDRDERSEAAREILGVDRELARDGGGCGHAATAGALPMSAMKLSSMPGWIGSALASPWPCAIRYSRTSRTISVAGRSVRLSV